MVAKVWRAVNVIFLNNLAAVVVGKFTTAYHHHGLLLLNVIPANNSKVNQ